MWNAPAINVVFSACVLSVVFQQFDYAFTEHTISSVVFFLHFVAWYAIKYDFCDWISTISHLCGTELLAFLTLILLILHWEFNRKVSRKSFVCSRYFSCSWPLAIAPEWLPTAADLTFWAGLICGSLLFYGFLKILSPQPPCVVSCAAAAFEIDGTCSCTAECKTHLGEHAVPLLNFTANSDAKSPHWSDKIQICFLIFWSFSRAVFIAIIVTRLKTNSSCNRTITSFEVSLHIGSVFMAGLSDKIFRGKGMKRKQIK